MLVYLAFILIFFVLQQISPLKGSEQGRTKLTVNGHALNGNLLEVVIGDSVCETIESTYSELTCWTPSGTSGPADIKVQDKDYQIEAQQIDTTFTFNYETPPIVKQETILGMSW